MDDNFIYFYLPTYLLLSKIAIKLQQKMQIVKYIR